MPCWAGRRGPDAVDGLIVLIVVIVLILVVARRL